MTNIGNNGGLPPFSKFIENLSSPTIGAESSSVSTSPTRIVPGQLPMYRGHSHTTSLPNNLEARAYLRDAGNNYVSPVSPGYHNYIPYRNNHEYPYNYQFPPSPYTPQRNGNYVQRWSPEISMDTFGKLTSLFKEVNETIAVVQTSYNNIFTNSNANPPNSTNKLNIGNRYINIEYLKDSILSLPDSLDKLTNDFNQGIEFVHQMRQIQALLYKQTQPRLQGFAIPQRPDINHQQQVYHFDNEVNQHKRRFASTGNVDPPNKKSESSKRSNSETETSNGQTKKSPKKASFIKFEALKGKRSNSPSACNHCGSEKTPEWRRGPQGDKTLCNACGIFYAKLIKKYHSPEEAANIMQQRKSDGLQHDRHV